MMAGRHVKETAEKPSRRGSALAVVVILLSVVLLVFAAIRVGGWFSRRQDAGTVVLVNRWNPVENSGFTPKLQEVQGVRVDESLVKPLEELLAAARSAGFAPALRDGYLTAEEENGSGCTVPGESEHELGLAVHFSEQNGRDADFSQWLAGNAWRCGFILRYPEGAEESTGLVSYSHYRYVGPAVAEQIRTLGISLEEYMDLFYGDSAEVIFEK